jgi:8-oxo-dGTP diphosphatase
MIVDAIFRTGYRAVYRAARIWWFIRRPRTAGSVVAIWSLGRVLLVRTSYRPQYSLPGGFTRRSETPAQGAARELHEELGIRIDSGRLKPAWQGVKHFEHREDTITILEIEFEEPPPASANHREVVWVGWKTAAEALRLPLLSQVRDYLGVKTGAERQ